MSAASEVSDATRARLGGEFAFDATYTLEIRGKGEPLRCHALSGPARARAAAG